MAYQRKTHDEWHIEVTYDGGRTWEHECTEFSWTATKVNLKAYRQNCPQYPVRSIKRRVRNEVA
jgi:hypothetical protein